MNSNQLLEILAERIDETTGKLLAKAVGVTVSDANDLIVQDLEPAAYISTWSGQELGELTLMRTLPAVTARKVKHEFASLNNWGPTGAPAMHFGDLSVPPMTKPKTDLLSVHARLLGTRIPIGLLPALVAPNVNVAGTTNQIDLAARALWQTLNFNTEFALVYNDTEKSLAGDVELTGLVYRGILQQIRDITDGTTGSSPLGTVHVEDMRGEALTLNDFRTKLADVGDIFGNLTACYMPGKVREILAQSYDDAARWMYQGSGPGNMQPVNLVPGQSIDGIRNGYGVLNFLISKHLAPMYAKPLYHEVTETQPDRPRTRPMLITTAAAGADPDSEFTADDAGAYAWVVTEVTDTGHETFGARVPASGFTSVVEGDGVTFTLAPRQSNTDRFRIYRMKQGDPNVGSSTLTGAWMLTEVAAEAGGANKEFSDLNADLPRTADVFACRLGTPAARALVNPQDIGQVFSRASQGDFMPGPPDPTRDNIARVRLGPETGTIALAQSVVGVSNNAIFRAGAVQVVNSFVWHWKNVRCEF